VDLIISFPLSKALPEIAIQYINKANFFAQAHTQGNTRLKPGLAESCLHEWIEWHPFHAADIKIQYFLLARCVHA
jgi:hypothetical protein